MTKEKKEEEYQNKSPHVHVAVNQVKAAISKTGIGKDRTNEIQKYKFRGIDDVYNALAPILAEANLNVYPNVLRREVVERVNQKGTALFYVTVEVRFDFVSAIDGSIYQVVTYGEAMDSGDKATNKAMSAALKYAFMQTFCIPTEGDNDADSQTHEVKGSEKKPDLSMAIDREQAEEVHSQAIKKLSACETVESLQKTWTGYAKTLKSLPEDLAVDLIQKKDECKADLTMKLNGHYSIGA